jgi:crotonobetainyl-CoA:carnitine CoA-transferase CaiB-like acyl-CoA transferase
MALLSGIRVIDTTTTFLGPYCTLIMAELGADVVKIERPPHGDVSRTLVRGRNPGMSSVFLNVNRGKRSVALDLKHPLAGKAMATLVRGADVFIHNMRPVAARSLGLGYDELVAVNPTLVYCGAYGFGEEGPYAGKPAYDDIIQAVSGIASLQAAMTGTPQYVASVIADKTVGLTALWAILAALLHRQRTGAGQAIEVPMFETMAAYALLEQMGGKTFEPPQGPALYPRTISRHRRPYRTADGYVSVLIYTDDHWKRFLTFVGRNDLVSDERFASADRRTEHIDEVYEFVAETLTHRTTAEWIAAFEQIDVPAMPVKSIDDLFEDEHLNRVGFFQLREHPTEGMLRTLRQPVRFSSGDPVIRDAPRLGEHTIEVLKEAGMTDDEVRALIEDHAVIDDTGR